MDQSFIKPYCVSTWVINLQTPETPYLLLKRCGKYLTGTWQMISGGIENGEKAWQAALREVQEETGLKPDLLYSADAVENFYEASRDAIVFVPVFIAYIRQAESIRLSPQEHDAYQWCSLETACEYILFSEQKRILQHIHTHFTLKRPNNFFLLYKKL